MLDMHSPVNAVHENFISNLESTFSESIHIQDAQKSEHASEGDDNCDARKGNLCGGFEQQETKLNMKCLKECSTFPYLDMMLPSSSSDEEEADTSLTESLSERSPHQSYSCSVSLESTFSESLHIQDAQKSEHVSDGDDNCDARKGILCGGFEQQETKLNMKRLKKCSTFPYPDMMLPSSSSDEEADTSLTESLSEQSPHQSYSCSVSLPAPPKLVSAMKGSREKQGGSPMILTVKWAPDVYDPVPTLSDPVKSKKQQKCRNKKSEKKKGQKGYSSKWGSSKDKKQYRKLGGASDLCYGWLDSHDKVIEASDELDALES